MKEKPILFNSEMVRAILDGRKTQTRRILKCEGAVMALQQSGCRVICSSIGGIRNGRIDFKKNTSIAERRLYGWERWQDLLKDEIQRLWEEGVRGLVSVEGPPNSKGVLRCVLVSRERENNKISSPVGLYGISWDAKDYINAGKALGRKSKKQQTKKSKMGDTGGKLAGQEGTRERDRGREAPDVKANGQREGLYSLGLRKGVGIAKAHCKDVGDVTIIYRENVKYEVGMNLWVRETMHSDGDGWWFPAAGGKFDFENTDAKDQEILEWCTKQEKQQRLTVPSIHMPRWASRIQLKITNILVERVKDISTEDILSEGLTTTLREFDAECHLKEQWVNLWDSINGKDENKNWSANPLVWVVEFERVR